MTPQQFQERRIFFDFICSPPKGVSILAVTMNDQRIVEAHKEASTIGIRELEQFAAARIRKGGIEDRTASPATWSARPSCIPRPALSTRNCTRISSCSTALGTRQEKRWKALQTGDMFGAHQLRHGGLSQRTGQTPASKLVTHTRKAANGFEIEGVDAELIERFSKRSQQRDMAVKRQESKLGRKLTKQEIAHVVHQSRPKKLKGASDEQVRRQQLGEIGFFEKRALRKVVAAADGQPEDFTATGRDG